MYKPMEALEQSFLRTKARDYAWFMKVAELKANSSNNTIFADDKGEIAYLHPQFMPARDNRFDYTKPVDGADPATDWKGLHALEGSAAALIRRRAGCSTPTTGPTRPRAREPQAEDFPRYMDRSAKIRAAFTPRCC